MRNFVARHDFNRAATHSSKKDYSRAWAMDWDEIEPPKTSFDEGCFGVSI